MDAPTHVAVMLACVGTVTTLVLTWNVAIVAPCSHPSRRVAGVTVKPTNGGFSVSVTILDAPTHVAVMLACVGTVTALVVTTNVAVVAPAATVTEAGTVAALVLLLVNATTAPPAGAAAGKRDGTGAVSAADQYGRVQRQGTQQRVHDEPACFGDAIVSGGDGCDRAYGHGLRERP